VVVVSPVGVETVVFFVADDFSAQPTTPIPIAHITNQALITRFISNS